MTKSRVCCICNISINKLRRDAVTCSSSCRGKLFRSNQTKTVLVRFRVPISNYTDLAIKAFIADKGMDAYLTDLVVASK